MQTKVIFMGYTANWISWVFWILSILGFHFFNLVYGQIPELEWYHVTEFSLCLQEYWLAILMMIVVIVEMDYIVECFFSIVYPTSRDHLVMQLERIEKKLDGNFKNQFLSINEVSNLTSLSASTIRRAIGRGELKCSKKLGKLLFQESDVRKWLNG